MIRDKIKVFSGYGISLSTIAKVADVPVSTLSRYMRKMEVKLSDEHNEKVLVALKEIASALYVAVNKDDIIDSIVYDDDDLEALSASGDDE